jgi:ribonuclease G
MISRRVKWFLGLMKWVTVISDSSLALNEYQFLNTNGEAIQV